MTEETESTEPTEPTGEVDWYEAYGHGEAGVLHIPETASFPATWVRPSGTTSITTPYTGTSITATREPIQPRPQWVMTEGYENDDDKEPEMALTLLKFGDDALINPTEIAGVNVNDDGRVFVTLKSGVQVWVGEDMKTVTKLLEDYAHMLSGVR